MLLAVARRQPVLLDLVVLSLPYGLVIVPRLEWFGGWSPPFRYALVVLPLLALTTVPLLARRRRGGARALLAALAALTLILTVLWVAVPGWTYNFADGRNYLLDHLDARLGVDLARFFPSSVRPRAATWAWPLVTLVAVPLRLVAAARGCAGRRCGGRPRCSPPPPPSPSPPSGCRPGWWSSRTPG